MISFVFPPFNFSGTERPFQFARYLPEFGFSPIIISQKNFVNYCKETDFDSLKKLSPETKLYRLKTIDSMLSSFPLSKWGDNIIEKLTGKKRIVSRLIQIPCNLIYAEKEWEFRVFWLAVYLKFKKKPKLIWATGPEWKNLEIGYKISKLLAIPLIVDMRDPWTYGVLWHPENEKDAEKQKNKEKKILKHATKVIFTSPKTEEIMLSQNQRILDGKTHTILNGFDKELKNTKKTLFLDKFVISYTGMLSREVRNPKLFLEGFKTACENEGFRNDVLLQFIGYLDEFKEEIVSYNQYDNIKIQGPISREESIKTMVNSDVLLLIQTIPGIGNDVIGGKLFEYINTQKPILGVVPHNGGDAWLLNQTNLGIVTGITDIHLIKDTLIQLWENWKYDSIEKENKVDLSKFKRYHLTGELATIFNEIVSK